MRTSTIMFIIAGICFIASWIGFRNQNSGKKAVERIVSSLNTKYDKVALLGYEKSIEKLNFVAFDNKNNELLLRTKGNPDFIIKYEDIENVELIENNKTTLSLKNIALGGAIAGNVGMVLGGMNKKEKITSRKLKFHINNFNIPSYEVDLLNNGGTKEYGIEIMFEVNKILDTIN